MSEFTVRDVVDFILVNRKNGAFNNWTADRLAVDIASGIKNNRVAVVTDNDEIVGVCVVEGYVDSETLRVQNILAKPGCIKYLLDVCQRLHPNVKYLTATRSRKNNKSFRYSICKLLSLT